MTRRRAWFVLLGLPAAALAASVPAHDLHLTYIRMTVQGDSVVCRFRFFQDDLEQALRTYSRQPALRAGPARSPGADSVFVAYLAATTRVVAGGTRLVPRLRSAAPDTSATDQRLWMYTVAYVAPRRIERLSLRVSLLFEVFRDQRNVVTIVKDPGGVRSSLLFAPGDTTEKEVPDRR